MNNAIIRRSEQIYSFLLKFYPSRYRREFGEEMKFVFSESLKDTYVENGGQGIITLWARIITDASKSLVTQHMENQKGLPLEALAKKGGDSMKSKSNDIVMQNKVFLWIALATGLILLIPLVAMQFTGEVNWGLGDFVVMGTLMFGLASIFVLIARKTDKKNRLAVGLVILAIFLWLWVELAVGLFTNWGS